MGDSLLSITIVIIIFWFILVLIAVTCYWLRPVYQPIREYWLDRNCWYFTSGLFSIRLLCQKMPSLFSLSQLHTAGHIGSLFSVNPTKLLASALSWTSLDGPRKSPMKLLILLLLGPPINVQKLRLWKVIFGFQRISYYQHENVAPACNGCKYNKMITSIFILTICRSRVSHNCKLEGLIEDISAEGVSMDSLLSHLVKAQSEVHIRLNYLSYS